MKSAANFLGVELSYEEAIVYCGAAFRITWNETCWDGGNVDAIFAFDAPWKVFRLGLESLGYESNLLVRTANTHKSEFIDFIKEKINKGIPIIACGIIGPPEAGVITGYRNNGETLLGWNVFQEYQDVAGVVNLDDSGYYITDKWWENPDTKAVMSYGETTGQRFTLKTIIENAIEVMTPRKHGDYAKAGYAYDTWKKALLDEREFSENMISPLLVERLMCQGDAMDCISDGRSSASKFFKRLADNDSMQPLLYQISDQFALAASSIYKMYEILGGYERGEAQMKAMVKPEVRLKLANLIDECKVADTKALELLTDLAGIL